VVTSEQVPLFILASCFESNEKKVASEKLRINKLAVIQEEICLIPMTESKQMGKKRRKVKCHEHKQRL